MTKAITKNGKKGFTLVELVIVIAILAILAAIAIPVVQSVINTAAKNTALANADTIELAVKECQSQIAAKNNEIYNGSKIDGVDIPDAIEEHGDVNILHVAKVKAIKEAFNVVTYSGKNYIPYWITTTDKCVFAYSTAGAAGAPATATVTDIDGNTIYNAIPLATNAGAPTATNTFIDTL